jgi:hypothetical protein
MRHSSFTTTLIIGAAIIAGAAVTLLRSSTRDSFFTHTVVAGESVSLICIDYYGYYSTALGSAIMADNPRIKNINLIHPGEKLSLRTPKEPSAITLVTAPEPAGRAAVDEPPAELFTKKMGVVQGVVTCVEGTATVRAAAGAAAKPLGVNAVVVPGNIIETGRNGRVEIIINREVVVRLREQTVLELERIAAATTSGEKSRVECRFGALWTKVKQLKNLTARFETGLPTAVAGVYGTVYETVVGADSSAEVAVRSGEVAVRGTMPTRRTPVAGGAPGEVSGPHEIAPPHEVSMEEWTRIVRSMEKITIDRNGVASSPTPFSRQKKSSWEQWNETRDHRIAALFGEQHR